MDHREVLRNAERVARHGPTVVVAEVTPGGIQYHRGYTLRTRGTLEYTSSPRTPLLTVRLQPHYEDEKIYSAFHTTDEIELDAPTAPAVDTPASTEAAKPSPAKAKPTIKKETPKPDGEE